MPADESTPLQTLLAVCLRHIWEMTFAHNSPFVGNTACRLTSIAVTVVDQKAPLLRIGWTCRRDDLAYFPFVQQSNRSILSQSVQLSADYVDQTHELPTFHPHAVTKLLASSKLDLHEREVAGCFTMLAHTSSFNTSLASVRYPCQGVCPLLSSLRVFKRRI